MDGLSAAAANAKAKSGARERPPDALGRRVHGRGGSPFHTSGDIGRAIT